MNGFGDQFPANACFPFRFCQNRRENLLDEGIDRYLCINRHVDRAQAPILINELRAFLIESIRLAGRAQTQHGCHHKEGQGFPRDFGRE